MLEPLCARGVFGSDLFYRLKLVRLCLPPLRARPGDARLLAAHFLGQCAGRYRLPNLALDDGTLRALDEYDWPGNVRELENMIHSAALMGHDGPLKLPIPQNSQSGPCPQTPEECAHGHPVMPYTAAKMRAREKFDREYLSNILEKSNAQHHARGRTGGPGTPCHRQAREEVLDRRGALPSLTCGWGLTHRVKITPALMYPSATSRRAEP